MVVGEWGGQSTATPTRFPTRGPEGCQTSLRGRSEALAPRSCRERPNPAGSWMGQEGGASKREKAGLRTAGGDGEQLAPGAWYAPAGRGRRRARATHLPVLLLVGQRQPWHVPHEVLPLPRVLVRGYEDDLQAVRGLWLSGRARPRPGPRPSGRVPSQAAVEGGQAGAELRAGGAQAAPEVEPQQRDAAGSQRVHVHLLAAARHQLVAQQLLQEARHPGPPQPRHAGGRAGGQAHGCYPARWSARRVEAERRPRRLGGEPRPPGRPTTPLHSHAPSVAGPRYAGRSAAAGALAGASGTWPK